MVRKSQKRAGLILKCFCSRDKDLLMKAFCAYVRPLLTYSTPVWSPHVQNVITTCAQTLYALRVLRAHGLCDSALQIIFRAVIVAKLMYASSTWWGISYQCHGPSKS